MCKWLNYLEVDFKRRILRLMLNWGDKNGWDLRV